MRSLLGALLLQLLPTRLGQGLKLLALHIYSHCMLVPLSNAKASLFGLISLCINWNGADHLQDPSALQYQDGQHSAMQILYGLGNTFLCDSFQIYQGAKDEANCISKQDFWVDMLLH